MLLFINDLPKIINNKSKLVLFADDTSVIVMNPILTDIKMIFLQLLDTQIRCLKAVYNLYFDKTHYFQFITKNNYFVDLKIGYIHKQIAGICNTKFLGIVIDNSLSWKLHTEQIIPNLSAACYAVRSFKPYISHETLKKGLSLLFSFHSDTQINIFKIEIEMLSLSSNSTTRADGSRSN